MGRQHLNTVVRYWLNLLAIWLVLSQLGMAQVPRVQFSDAGVGSAPVPGAALAPGIQPFDPYAAPSAPPPPPLGYPGIVDPTIPSAGWPGGGAIGPVPGPLVGSDYGAIPPAVVAPPQATTPLFPQGIVPQGTFQGVQRLFQHTGFRYTWLHGKEGDELQMHDVEVSTTAVFPNFLYGTGMRVTPGFVFHFLDGPSFVPADLPSRLYSAYLDAGWAPRITPQLSADVDARIGVYSDFQTFTSDSLRILGTGVGVVQLTPTTSVKLGAAYIDRAKVKILPAAGILWVPNVRSRWDLFFPSPKISHYWTNIGNSEVWWYVGGEYGGGSWTIDRDEPPEAGASERIDINDIRVFAGLEWQTTRRWFGFLEAGYVFDREIFFVVVPQERLPLEDTVMLRGGLSF